MLDFCILNLCWVAILSLEFPNFSKQGAQERHQALLHETASFLIRCREPDWASSARCQPELLGRPARTSEPLLECCLPGLNAVRIQHPPCQGLHPDTQGMAVLHSGFWAQAFCFCPDVKKAADAAPRHQPPSACLRQDSASSHTQIPPLNSV